MKTFFMKGVNKHVILYANYRRFGFDVAYSYENIEEYPHLIHINIAFWAIEISF